MSLSPAHDRLGHLLAEQPTPSWNGVDFVELASRDGSRLRVHFLNAVPLQGTFSAIPPVTISGGERGSVDVLPIDEAHAWSADDAGRPVLSIAVAAPTDESTYTLHVHSTVLDPYFDAAQFSFAAGQASGVDCGAAGLGAGAAGPTAAPINYLAKDFATFRQALLDFSALRYPQWVERSEADIGMMLLEALSAIADELSYLQDRVAAEARLGTATQRVSLVRHGRLVDYDPSPPIAATALLQFDVAAGVTALSAGLRCSAAAADGRRIPFEVDSTLADPVTGQLQSAAYLVDAHWNAGPPEARNLLPYWWDTSRQVLPAGSHRLWIIGHQHGFMPAQQLLIDTAGTVSADPPVREVVTVAAATETRDEVFGVDLTQIELAEPTELDHDLNLTHFAGNLLPAVQGERVRQSFGVPDDVVVRLRAESTSAEPRPDLRFPLTADSISWVPHASTASVPALAPPQSLTASSRSTGGSLATGSYAYQVTALTADGETTATAPVSVAVTGPTGSVELTWPPVAAGVSYEIYGRTPGSPGVLARVGPFGGAGAPTWTDTGAAVPDPSTPPPATNTTAVAGPAVGSSDLSAQVAAVPQIALVSADGAVAWRWQRWLLGSGPADPVFSLTPERYAQVGASGGRVWFDYDGDGMTLQFGDGTFGLTPVPGDAFVVTYLAGGGAIGNVPADTIAELDSRDAQRALVQRVTNPFAATGGTDAETPQQIRDRAPQAFQANPLRIVLAEDYVRAAKSLPWVMQAGASFRWTGSWITAFTTADPQASESLTVAQLEELSDLLGRRRLAGYESYALAPSYVSLDIEITVLAETAGVAGDVGAAVRGRLRPGVQPDGSRGFFDHERWSFGQPLESSALLAAIQGIPGVLGVLGISYRQHGLGRSLSPLPETLPVPSDQILRVDDDPAGPEAGTLRVIVEVQR